MVVVIVLCTEVDLPYNGGLVSGPHGECVPVDVLQEGAAVLGQAVDEATGQRGGHLEKLIGVEQRRHRGVQPTRINRSREFSTVILGISEVLGAKF